MICLNQVKKKYDSILYGSQENWDASFGVLTQTFAENAVEWAAWK